MKKMKRIVAVLLVLVTLMGISAIPVSAAYSYPMSCTIYYKDTSGKQLYKTYTGSTNATEPNLSVTSPTISGYVLKNSGDSVVTYAMMTKSFPASNYVRQGSATYTVYYVKAGQTTIYYRYLNQSGWAAPEKVIKGKEGESYTVYSPTVTGYTPNKTYVSGTLSAGNGINYVYYSENVYTVSYNANGGSGAPSAQTKSYTKALTLSTTVPTRTGYDFLGWSTSSSATSASYSAGGSFTTNANTTLYAVWKEKTYTVTFDANGGSGGPMSIVKRYTAVAVIPYEEPTRDGYTFRGWSTSKNGSVAYEPADYYKSNSARTLYAVWEKIPEKYAILYYGNGGSGAPATQTKTEGVSICLSTVEPTREGHTFLGWGLSSTTKTVAYYPGEEYSSDEALNLYAIWQVHTYTVSYNANSGTNAPANQTKTYGIDLDLSTAEPTRAKYDFLGWATSASATTAEYAPGATFETNADTTLYAVWRLRNYDFSVSNLKATPNSVYQYDTVSVTFRMDSWDRYNAYTNVPVSVLLNGKVIYSTTVSFSAYGVQYGSFDLSCGGLEGIQTLTARVNWSDYTNETRTTNNETTATFSVERVIETNVTLSSISGEYCVGEQAVTSFYIGNEGMTAIYPDDHLTAVFEVYTYESGEEKILVSQSKTDIVVPANKQNLVYFKWTVPESAEGKICWVRCTVNADNLPLERNKNNNSREFAIVPQSRAFYSTPNTQYEETAPSDYSANVSEPSIHNGSATWTQWVYENGAFTRKQYGIRIGMTNVTVEPASTCTTAQKVNGVWNMKSGYGITVSWYGYLTSVSGVTLAPTDSYTNIQNVVATFPEYGFEIADGKSVTLNQIGSYYKLPMNTDAGNDRVHFIPVYVQDGSYTVSVKASGVWTPAGYLYSVRNSNVITVSGTVYDDWYNG